MLQRYIIHLALVFLFAFTQIGVATHEISHITDPGQHSQQEPSQQDQKSQSKQSVAEQCAQCLNYAKVASGLESADFEIPAIKAASIEIGIQGSGFQSAFTSAYAARAPPQIISI